MGKRSKGKAEGIAARQPLIWVGSDSVKAHGWGSGTRLKLRASCSWLHGRLPTVASRQVLLGASRTSTRRFGVGVASLWSARPRGPSAEARARHGRTIVSAAPAARAGQENCSIAKEFSASGHPLHEGMV